ncbi:MAG: glycine cleavage system aminomethyltransferase GcvT [Leptospiraceae bacterium]|nr:glycine cleavage system aminomethyltransferase GcvT [Leptospiraceae bacterium]
MEDLKKTPLNEIHKSLGAKMVPFGGWEMPVQYSQIIQEHLATREKAGLFDVSHMGEIFLEGEEVKLLEFLEKMTCNSISSMKDGQVQYNAVLNEAGGLVDDVTIYKFSSKKYMICSNASNFEAVFAHLQKYNSDEELNIRNESIIWHQIAIQGPNADRILAGYLKEPLSSIGYYRFKELPFEGKEIIVSRTGYTGEDGFEIYSNINSGLKIWQDLLDFGKEFGITPVGLGARDTLRLEAKYPLYGHELNSERTPVESGIGWIVKEKTTPFLGYDKIIDQKKNGAKVGLTGIIMEDPGIPRENFKIFDEFSVEIGFTTSGTFSPSLKKGIALAILEKGSIVDGNTVFIEIRGEKKKAKIQKGNFITGSVKNKK